MTLITPIRRPFPLPLRRGPVYADDFQSHAYDAAPKGWTLSAAGGAKVRNGQLLTVLDDTYVLADGTSDTGALLLEMEIPVVNKGGLVWRVQGDDKNKGYYARLLSATDLTVFRRNTTFTQIGAETTISITLPCVMRVTMIGSAMTVEIVGQGKSVSVTDTTYATGGAGLKTVGTSGVVANWIRAVKL